jgi:hypothetical protein
LLRAERDLTLNLSMAAIRGMDRKGRNEDGSAKTLCYGGSKRGAVPGNGLGTAGLGNDLILLLQPPFRQPSCCAWRGTTCTAGVSGAVSGCSSTGGRKSARQGQVLVRRIVARRRRAGVWRRDRQLAVPCTDRVA